MYDRTANQSRWSHLLKILFYSLISETVNLFKNSCCSHYIALLLFVKVVPANWRLTITYTRSDPNPIPTPNPKPNSNTYKPNPDFTFNPKLTSNSYNLNPDLTLSPKLISIPYNHNPEPTLAKNLNLNTIILMLTLSPNRFLTPIILMLIPPKRNSNPYNPNHNSNTFEVNVVIFQNHM